MPTSYTSNLRLALPVTGELAGTWGDTVNNAITSLLDDAVGGYTTVTVSPVANKQALTASNGATDQARNAVLKLNAGTVAAAFELYAPPTERTYVVWNNTGYTCTFYVATVLGGTTAAGTGFTILTGQKVLVYLDGTNVLEQLNHVGSLTLTSALPVTSGGTGVTTSTGTGSVVLNTSPTLVTPALGTPASGVATNLTGLPLTTGVTGTLPVLNGGTGVTTSTGTGNVVLSNSPTLVTPALGTPASGVATNLTGLPLTTGVTGTLPVLNGGTGVTTSTGTGSVVLSTSPTLVTPALGTPASGVATNLTGLPLTTGVTGTLPVANGGTGVTTSTGSGNVVLSTSPTLVTPALGTPASGVATNLTGLPLTTGVTGTLPVLNGGTGQTTYTDGQLLIGNSTGNTLTKATLTAGSNISITNGSGAITINATGSGTVSSVSVVSANGLAGTVATATTTPAITLSTSITGVLKGNGTAISAATAGTDYVTPTGTETLTNKTITGTKETRVTMGANNIDQSLGNWFTKTISGATTLTVSNTPASGTASSFILDLTNGGSATITWWSGTKWVGGVAPTLTAAGRDALGFYTYDGGTTWTGLVLGKDIK